MLSEEESFYKSISYLLSVTIKGPKSLAGCSYLGWFWSVVGTCRQQGRDVWSYLTEWVDAVAEGRLAPSLLTPINKSRAA